ncbi:MAG: phosphodiester glycosidase family protein [Myxococcota bacterium]
MLWSVASVASAADLAPGVTYRVLVSDGVPFRVVTVDLDRADLSLVGQTAGGPHTAADLAASTPPGWVAATNAGIFHRVDLPVGLWVETGVVRHPIERGDGAGNFFLKPNGVFTVDAGGARIVDAASYAPQPPVRLATQSGPALVLGGALHPKFIPDSPSVTIRNAVGVQDPHTVHLVYSEVPVRFWTLATFLRDTLRCPDALYLDGTISGLWGPALPSADGTRVGPPYQGLSYAGFLVVSPR